MGDTEYSYELTVNIVAEMVLDYLNKNSITDKDLERKGDMVDCRDSEKNMPENKHNKMMVA